MFYKGPSIMLTTIYCIQIVYLLTGFKIKPHFMKCESARPCQYLSQCHLLVSLYVWVIPEMLFTVVGTVDLFWSRFL